MKLSHTKSIGESQRTIDARPKSHRLSERSKNKFIIIVIATLSSIFETQLYLYLTHYTSFTNELNLLRILYTLLLFYSIVDRELNQQQRQKRTSFTNSISLIRHIIYQYQRVYRITITCNLQSTHLLPNQLFKIQ